MQRDTRPTVIHRATERGTRRWFTYEGSRYTLMFGGSGFGWEVYDQDDRLVDEYHTLRELRELFQGPVAPIDW